jgi:hypothetical protein
MSLLIGTVSRYTEVAVCTAVSARAKEQGFDGVIKVSVYYGKGEGSYVRRQVVGIQVFRK